MNKLIAFKKRDKDSVPYRNDFTEPEIEHWIRFREEHDEQIKALKKLINLGNEYGLDLSRPAQTAQEAVQWTYMGYLASIKSQDGAAMSFGRNSAFLDCYIERDLQAGKITETDAQELIDNIVMSCASCASCVPRTTIRSSPATRTGRPGPTLASAMTAVRWSPRPRSVCSTP